MPSVFKPGAFHGEGKTSGFFEGWYFKSFSADGDKVVAVVPGVFRSARETPEHSHAFIFVNVNGTEQHYYRFPVDQFVADSKRFHVVVAGKNEFSNEGFTLDLEPKEGDDASLRLCGALRFAGNTPWPISALSPGVMGPVAFMPFVECFHGVLSMDHQVAGELEMNGLAVSFAGGRGYLEKDWGKHFPKAWVWTQTNLFPGLALEEGERNPSLFFSAAQVPYMGTSFPGFICGFLDPRGKLHAFTSYKLSRFNTFSIDESSKQVTVQLQNGSHLLDLSLSYDVPMVTLYGPWEGRMEPTVPEGLQAHVSITLTKRRSGSVEFHHTGTGAGVEVQGDVQALCKALCK